MTEKGIPQKIEKHPNYVPQNGDLIYTIDPDGLETTPTIAMVIRQATRQDKINYVLRMQAQLPPDQELEKKTLRAWFKGVQYLCMEGEEITLIDPEFIAGPVRYDNSP
jgi:hypothetical protein